MVVPQGVAQLVPGLYTCTNKRVFKCVRITSMGIWAHVGVPFVLDCVSCGHFFSFTFRDYAPCGHCSLKPTNLMVIVYLICISHDAIMAGVVWAGMEVAG